MARNTGPTWRISRRLNFSVLETGEELAKRPYIPGQHGSATRRIKQSNYGLQKAEKQKMRHMYGLSEKQFYNSYLKAVKKKLEEAVRKRVFQVHVADSVPEGMAMGLNKNKNK